MAWYPGAVKRELQPESDSQPAIDPTQFIIHSIAAPWTEKRIGEYWDEPGVNLESHFGLSYNGAMGQFIGTETRADANAAANRRPDGTGAVSIETASNLQHTDPWTDAQVQALIALGVWLHQRHGIPLRICRSASDPGYGYHRLHRAWSTNGTACPGDARVTQFHEEVFPGIVRAAQGQPPGPVTPPVTPPDIPITGGSEMSVTAKTVPHAIGDDSATTFTAPPGVARIYVSVDYVPPGEKVSVRVDVSNQDAQWVVSNFPMSLGNGNVGWKDVPVSGKAHMVSVKRLTHPQAVLDATLYHRDA